MSDSLWPHEPQHARPPCPSSTPRVHPNPCPLSQWCHPTISSSVVPFSSCPQSFPASGSFPVSQFFASYGILLLVFHISLCISSLHPHISLLKPIWSRIPYSSEVATLVSSPTHPCSPRHLSSVQFSQSVVSDLATPRTTAHQASLSITNSQSLRNPCPLCQWCHLTISSSVVPFSSWPQSFPASHGTSLLLISFTLTKHFPPSGLGPRWHFPLSDLFYAAHSATKALKPFQIY